MNNLDRLLESTRPVVEGEAELLILSRVPPRAKPEDESAAADLVDRIRALAPGCAVFNHYGPTEATIGVATFRADRAEGRASAPSSRPGASH